MAATLTDSGELTYISFPIDKFEKNEEGDIYVWGKASDGSVDSDEQIVDTNFSSKAIQDWLSSGANVRVQHNSQRDPAGKGVEANTDNEGATWVKSLVVEPVAKRLVEKGILQAYSVGIARPKIIRDSVARGGRIVDGQVVEISLVDRPANKNCGIQLVKANKLGSAEWVGKMFGNSDLFAKSESDMVNVDLPKDASVSFKPSDLAKLMEYKKQLVEAEVEKRRMDPDVGGGVDRDKIPSKDFAGRNRSFPIVTPGDVSDAASSIGRAGEDNYSSDKLKENIIRIARRKGDAFVAELPETWKKELGIGGKKKEKSESSPDAAKGKNGKKRKKAFPEAHPEFTGRHQPPHDDDDLKPVKKGDIGSGNDSSEGGDDADVSEMNEAKPHVTKEGADGDENPMAADGEKEGDREDSAEKGGPQPYTKHPGETVKCPHCGKMNEPDAKFCDQCGQKLPESAFGSESAEKKEKVMCKGCGANVDAKHTFCPECGGKLKGSPQVEKNHDFTCLKCGRELDKGEKFCPKCGKGNPGYLPMADSKVKKAKKKKGGSHVGVDLPEKPDKNAPEFGDDAVRSGVKKSGGKTPGEASGAVGAGAAGEKPVPPHREPDGPYIEMFEHDARMEEGDEAAEMRAAQRVKSTGAPYSIGALHDLTCAAYHPAHADKCHPTVQLPGMDVSYWSQKAEDSVFGGTMQDAAKAQELWQHAVALKNTDPDVLSEIRYEAHKSFRDANPGPSTFPRPTQICAGDFKRPHISGGHADYGTGYQSPHTFDFGSVHEISANEYDRPYLSEGHAADSPSNKTRAIMPAPVPSGAPQRTYYRTAQRDSARSAMAAMHDHIAQTFPDLCPMSGPGMAGEPPVGARPVPTPQGAQKSEKKPGKSKKSGEVVTKAAAVDADIVKSAVLEATSGLADQIAELTKSLDVERKRSKKLAKVVDELSSMPDPNVSAFRGIGVGTSPTATKSSTPRDAVLSVAETAERAQAAMMQALTYEARSNPDPGQREAAWAKLYEMNGLTRS